MHPVWLKCARESERIAASWSRLRYTVFSLRRTEETRRRDARYVFPNRCPPRLLRNAPFRAPMKRATGDGSDVQARAAAAARVCKLRRLLGSRSAGEARRAATLIDLLVQRHALDDAALDAAAALDAEPVAWQHERELKERPPREMLLAQLRAGGRSTRNGAGTAAGDELGLSFGASNALARSLLSGYIFSRRHLTAVDLATRDCSSRTLGELLKLCGEQSVSLEQLHLGRPPCGHSDASGELAAAVADLYSTVRAPDILPLSPATCMTLTLQALLNAGDLVVCQWPANPQLFDLFADLGCRVLLWKPEDSEHGFRYSVDTLERILSSSSPAIDPVALVLGLPSEPIGWLPTHEAYTQMLDACKKRGTYIVADETHCWSTPEALRLTPLADAYELGVSIGSLGGPFGLPGLHCGWVACTNRVLLQRVEELFTYSSDTSVRSMNDQVALLALQPGVRNALLSLNTATLAANRELALRVFTRHHCFRLTPPLAGPAVFVQLVGERALMAPEFCDRLALACGVLCVPDACFQRRRGPTDLLASAGSWLCVSFGGGHAADGLRLIDGAIERLGPSLGVLEAAAGQRR